PYQKTELLLSPGERMDVLVKAARSSGNYKLRAMPYNRMGNSTSETITLMTITYKDKISPAQSIPASVNPVAKRLDPDTLEIMARRTLTLSMGRGNAYINGQDFDVDPYTIHSPVDTYEIPSVIFIGIFFK
ncbi:MAG: hypothetical protein O8C59_03910, partial [Candidatus Methanoperedens sp.]|nr:hypothetical protein [Candidatus Methanoperedens sp.]